MKSIYSAIFGFVISFILFGLFMVSVIFDLTGAYGCRVDNGTFAHLCESIAFMIFSFVFSFFIGKFSNETEN